MSEFAYRSEAAAEVAALALLVLGAALWVLIAVGAA